MNPNIKYFYITTDVYSKPRIYKLAFDGKFWELYIFKKETNNFEKYKFFISRRGRNIKLTSFPEQQFKRMRDLLSSFLGNINFKNRKYPKLFNTFDECYESLILELL